MLQNNAIYTHMYESLIYPHFYISQWKCTTSFSHFWNGCLQHSEDNACSERSDRSLGHYAVPKPHNLQQQQQTIKQTKNKQETEVKAQQND